MSFFVQPSRKIREEILHLTITHHPGSGFEQLNFVVENQRKCNRAAQKVGMDSRCKANLFAGHVADGTTVPSVVGGNSRRIWGGRLRSSCGVGLTFVFV